MSESRKGDEHLRDAFGAPLETTARSPECPEDERIWSAAQGEADAAITGSVLDHVAGCSACAESWRMARAIGEDAGIANVRKVPLHRRPLVWTVAAVAAGIFLVALLLPSSLDRRGVDPLDVFRAAESVALESRIDESVAVPRDRAILSWKGAPDGSVYTVEVATADLEILIRSESQVETEFRIPTEALGGIPDHGKVYWRVEALLPDSSRVSSSVFVLELQ